MAQELLERRPQGVSLRPVDFGTRSPATRPGPACAWTPAEMTETVPRRTQPGPDPLVEAMSLPRGQIPVGWGKERLGGQAGGKARPLQEGPRRRIGTRRSKRRGGEEEEGAGRAGWVWEPLAAGSAQVT